jgi:hypothetical protein
VRGVRRIRVYSCFAWLWVCFLNRCRELGSHVASTFSRATLLFPIAVLKQKYEPSGAPSSDSSSLLMIVRVRSSLCCYHSQVDHFGTFRIFLFWSMTLLLRSVADITRHRKYSQYLRKHSNTPPAGWHHDCLPQLRLGRQDRDQRLVGAFTPGLQDGPDRRVPDCGELHGAGQEELPATLPSGDGFRVPVSAGGELPGCAHR